MSNDITLPGTGTIVETLDTGAGQRQVVTIAPRDLSANDSIGPLTETAPATDTASSGLNGRLQRVAQNLTTAVTSLSTVNTSVGAVNTTLGTTNTNLSTINNSLSTINSSLSTINGTLGTTNSTLSTTNTNLTTNNTYLGTLTDAAPGTDTASASLNGRLQRVAQRLTSLIALMPPALGQTTRASSLPVTMPSDVTAAPSVTPTVTASSAYSAGNEAGGLLTFASAVGAAGSGMVQSVTVTSKTVQSTGLKLYLFSSNPSHTTWTDKAAPSISATDLPALIGIYALYAPDSGLGTMTVWNLNGIGQMFAGAGTSLYGVLVVTGTPTFGSTSDLTVTIGVLKD